MRRNPSRREEPGKYYALAQANGELTFLQLCKHVKSFCTVTRADVAAVVEAVIDSMIFALEEGKIVRLGNFGSFRLSLTGDGADTEKEYHPSLIQGTKIAFRPGELLVEMQNNLKFSQVPQLQKPPTDPEPAPDEPIVG